MLIASHRHIAADLELWHELEDADHVAGKRPSIDRRIKESADAIKRFVAAGPCYAGISWGKDSVVLAYILRCFAAHVPLVHLRPTNHNPDSDLVRDDFRRRFPGQPYTEVVVDYGDVHAKGLPDHILDAATDQTWYATIAAVERASGGRHILGIRSDESFGRMIRTMRWGLSTHRACAPLAHWSLDEIFGMLATRSLPAHPAYAMLGSGRWPRERLRVAEIGDTHGKGSGRREWEEEYYGDVLRRLETSSRQPLTSNPGDGRREDHGTHG